MPSANGGCFTQHSCRPHRPAPRTCATAALSPAPCARAATSSGSLGTPGWPAGKARATAVSEALLQEGPHECRSALRTAVLMQHLTPPAIAAAFALSVLKERIPRQLEPCTQAAPTWKPLKKSSGCTKVSQAGSRSTTACRSATAASTREGSSCMVVFFGGGSWLLAGAERTRQVSAAARNKITQRAAHVSRPAHQFKRSAAQAPPTRGPATALHARYKLSASSLPRLPRTPPQTAASAACPAACCSAACWPG